MQTQYLVARSSCEWKGDAFESHSSVLCGKPCGETAEICNVHLSCINAAVPRIVAGSMDLSSVGPVAPRGNKKKKTAQTGLQTPSKSKRQVLWRNPPERPSRTSPLTGRGFGLVRYISLRERGRYISLTMRVLQFPQISTGVPQ